MREGSSIDAVAAAVESDSLDFGELSSPDGALTLLFMEGEDAAGVGERLGRIVEQHEGQVVKVTDAARMCSFASAHAGLHCAIHLQRELAGQLRIGLHAGFVMMDASEFYGRNVVLAARIADHAQPGEILVSRAVREYTGTDPTFEFDARGEQHFKGLLGEHPVYAVAWG
jgi:class 3 adenylate cyclase